jgi:hypothetical protein
LQLVNFVFAARKEMIVAEWSSLLLVEKRRLQPPLPERMNSDVELALNVQSDGPGAQVTNLTGIVKQTLRMCVLSLHSSSALTTLSACCLLRALCPQTCTRS